MDSSLFPLVVFLIGAPLLWLYFRRKNSQQVSSLADCAHTLGLTFVDDPQTNKQKLADMPPFRLLASGGNQHFKGHMWGERQGVPYELLYFHKSDQTSSNQNYDYYIFSAPCRSASPDFSLVPTDLLEKWRDSSNRTKIDLADWPQLQHGRALHVYHSDLDPYTNPIGHSFMQKFSKLMESGDRPRAEKIDGRFIYYVDQRGIINADAMNKVIADGFDLLTRLG